MDLLYMLIGALKQSKVLMLHDCWEKFQIVHMQCTLLHNQTFIAVGVNGTFKPINHHCQHCSTPHF